MVTHEDGCFPEGVYRGGTCSLPDWHQAKRTPQQRSFKALSHTRTHSDTISTHHTSHTAPCGPHTQSFEEVKEGHLVCRVFGTYNSKHSCNHKRTVLSRYGKNADGMFMYDTPHLHKPSQTHRYASALFSHTFKDTDTNSCSVHTSVCYRVFTRRQSVLLHHSHHFEQWAQAEASIINRTLYI